MLSLDKITPGQTSPFRTRQWQDTVTLWVALQNAYGTRTGDSLYEGLSDNDLRTLSTCLRLRDGSSF